MSTETTQNERPIDEQLSGAILDTLDTPLAVIDAEGFVTKTNSQWKNHTEDGNSCIQVCSAGTSYLDFIENQGANILGTDRSVVLKGIREVLSSKSKAFSWTYNISETDSERSFEIQLSNIPGVDGLSLIQHRNLNRRFDSKTQAPDTQTTQLPDQYREKIASEAAKSSIVGDNIAFVTDAVDDLFELVTSYKELIEEEGYDKKALTSRLNEKDEELDLDFLVDELPNVLNQARDGIKRVGRILRDLKNTRSFEA